MAIRAVLDIAGRTGKMYQGSDAEVTIPYIVFTDSRADDEAAILASGVLPNRGDLLATNTYLAASSCTLKREDKNPLVWRANVTFKPDSLNQPAILPNPLERPAEVEWDAVAYTVPATETAEDYIPPGEADVVPAGSPIVNSAWDLFDPPAEKTAYYWVATLEKNVAAVPVWILDVAGCVNNSSYVIDDLPIAEGASRLVGVRIGRRQRENGFNFRQVRFAIEFRRLRPPRTPGEQVPLPWILELEDMGYNRNHVIGGSTYQTGGVTRTRILGTDNKPVPFPVHLDGTGDELASPTPTTTVKRHFKIYTTADFSQLPLV